MKFNKTIYTTLFAVLLSCTAMVAQENSKHELSIWGAGGLSTLKYSPKVGDHKNGFGGQFGLGYTYFFTRNWGLGTGAELSLHNAKTKLGYISGSYDTKDYEGNDFNFRYTLHNYEDKQTTIFVNIPLMLQYQTTGTNRFFASLGGKIGLPINEKSKISKYDIQSSGYYTDENWEYTDEPYMGFGRFGGKGKKEDLDFKISYMLSAEAGMKWAVGEKNSLYTGAYIDYGLNDINKTKSSNNRIFAYNALQPTDFEMNSVMNTNYNNDGNLEPTVKKVNQLAAGVKVRFAFGMGGNTKKAVIQEKIELDQPIPAFKDDSKAKEEAERKRKEQLAKEKELERQRELERKKEQEVALLREKELKEKTTQNDRVILETSIASGYSINKVNLTSDLPHEMDQKVAILKKHPTWSITVIGHTCNLGASAVNHRVGLHRAQDVKKHLVKNGIDSNRILVESKGEKEPLAPNTNSVNRKKNRRVEIKLNSDKK